MPLVLTVATRVAGVVAAEAETLSQPGDAATVKGSAVVPVRLMDWLAGLVPPLCAVNVKLDGLSDSAALPETTRATLRVCGELEAPPLRMERVALYVPGDMPAGLTLAVMLAGVVALDIVMVSQAGSVPEVETVIGSVEYTLTNCAGGVIPPL